MVDTSNRVNQIDKRIFGGKTDQNQIIPIKYSWAWEAYLEANRHHWLPGHIQFAMDLRDGPYEKQLKAGTYKVLELYLSWRTVVSQFCRESIPLIYRNLTAPECRQFLLRMLQEESVSISAFTAVPLQNIKSPELGTWRRAMYELLIAVSLPHRVPDMEDMDFVAMASIVLQMKGKALVPMEEWLMRNPELPVEMKKMLGLLIADTQRQVQFFANVIANFLQERPHLQEFAKACLNSVVTDSFLLHWSGQPVSMGTDPARQSEHLWSSLLNRIGISVPIVSSPYRTVAATVVIDTSTKQSLDWD